MSYFFSSHQIAEMAMLVEEKGIEFYKRAAELPMNDKMKKIFLFLSDAEINHKETFRKIMETEKKHSVTYEYTVDVASNIRYLIEKIEKAVFDLKSVQPVSPTAGMCLDVGIHVESGLIAAYTEIHQKFINRFHDVLEKIIVEEKNHLKMLQRVREQSGL